MRDWGYGTDEAEMVRKSIQLGFCYIAYTLYLLIE